MNLCLDGSQRKKKKMLLEHELILWTLTGHAKADLQSVVFFDPFAAGLFEEALDETG